MTGRLKWIITIAITASGTLTQNTDCQWWNSHDQSDAVHRAEHAAELLRGADAAEHRGAVACRPQIGGESQGDRQQRTAGGALDDATDDQRWSGRWTAR